LLTEHGLHGIALGTGLSKLTLESRGEGGEEAALFLNTLVRLARPDAGPLLPIDGSREVDLDWIYVVGCSCRFCCWSVGPCASEQNPPRGLVNFEAVPGGFAKAKGYSGSEHVKTKEM
jgi:hypothetical protein